MKQPSVSLLRFDPDLGSGLTPADFVVARKALVAPSVTLEPGNSTSADMSGCDDLGEVTMLVLDGLLLSDIVLAGHPSAELIGSGDLLSSPKRRRNMDTLLPVDVQVTVLEPTRLAVLDECVQLACAHWPPVAVALLERMEQRGWQLAKQAAICQLPSVHSRLLALFWHLADRWGKVGPDHLVLPIRIVHRTLGKMVGAERSTVTLALGQLSEAGLVTRRHDGAWLLSGDPREGLELLAHRWGAPSASLVTDAHTDSAGGAPADRLPKHPQVRFQR